MKSIKIYWIYKIENYPSPTNVDEVKRFVAFTNYYRKYVPNFAQMAYSFNLCRRNVKFKWSEDCQNSFLYLKNAFVQPPILEFPDFSNNNEFILQTDVSNIAVGVALLNKNHKPVAASRSLNKSELNYPTIQKELVAIVWAVKHFRPYLYGRHFKIKTDHRSFKCICLALPTLRITIRVTSNDFRSMNKNVNAIT